MKILIYDIETYVEYFLIVIFNPVTGKMVEFRINKWENNLYAFLKFADENKDYFWVGYNNISFDNQVLEFVIRNHDNWVDKTSLEICSTVAEFAQDAIQRQNYRMPVRYFEEFLTLPPLDLMRIHHFDNEAKRTSLKWLEFMMDLEDIETAPIPYSKIGLTKDDCVLITRYCKNDVRATHILWLYTIGEVDNEIYRGKNKIQERLDIIQKFGLSPRALNWSDTKIGDELNLLGYTKLTGKTRKDVYAAKKSRKYKKLTFGMCIPDYVHFETPEFNNFLEKIKGEKINFYKKQEFPFQYNKTKYLIAKGGIHSIDKKRKIIPTKGEILRDADVGAQYPNAIYKRKLYPIHLGPQWLHNQGIMIAEKDKYKQLGKKGDMSAKGIEGMCKYALNAGGFGKTKEVNSWQYGPEVTYACTIGNEFEVLMLIEKLETNGIMVISANTDGIVCFYPEELDKKYKDICAWWEQEVGNTEMGKLEYTRFEKLFQTSVNDYIAIKMDGYSNEREKIKKKGDFATDHELHKNKSRRIVPIALEKYVVEGIPVEKTILSHTNIFDFMIGIKASSNYHYETIDENQVDDDKYERVLRYYVAKDGKLLLKIKNEDSEAKGNPVTRCEAPDKEDDKVWKCSIANSIDPVSPISSYNIDYEYYIRKCNKIIQSVEGKQLKNQISLF